MKWVSPVPGRTQVVIRTPGGLLVKATPARLVDAPLRRLIAEKFIRGLHYAEAGEPLGDVDVQAKMAINEALPADFDVVLNFLAQLPINTSLGPGLWYRRHHEPNISAWAFRIWGQVMILAFVKPKGSSATDDGPPKAR